METPAPNPPAFVTDRHDPGLAAAHALVEQFRAKQGRHLTLTVDPDVVQAHDISLTVNMIVAAQHHPDVLERLFLAIAYKFKDPAPIIPDALLEELAWKSSPEVREWLWNHTEALPFCAFFMQDRDTRFFVLFGDVLNAEYDQMAHRLSVSRKTQQVGLTDEQATLLFNRILDASLQLLHFCAPTGVDPQIVIEAVLADFDVSEQTGLGYADVFAHFERERARGATPTTTTREIEYPTSDEDDE